MPSLATTPPRTLTDTLVVPRWQTRPAVLDAILIVGFSLFVAVTARIAIPLPFTPVPITGQTFGVLLTGAVLGWRRGALALGLYLVEGLVGLPVFAPGGMVGLARLLGPTGGYLVAYPLAAGLVGYLAERGWDQRWPTAPLAMALGNLVIYALGVAGLARYVGGIAPAIGKGVLPFIPGDLLKIGLAAVVLPAGWALVRRFQDRP